MPLYKPQDDTAANAYTDTAVSDHEANPDAHTVYAKKATTVASNVYSGGAYPARPSGFGSVMWIGPSDPGASAQDNDTWVNTT